MKGWEIVCPDGLVRHYPYANQGDAECDAYCCEKRCHYPEGAPLSPLEEGKAPCPEGKHWIRRIVFDPPVEPS